MIVPRYNFTLLFESLLGNPNGDPDSDNRPRRDPLTLQGWCSDVMFKHKLRHWAGSTLVDAKGKPQAGNNIWVKHRGILSEAQREVFEYLGLTPDKSENLKAQLELCRRYLDIRWFGGLLSTGKTQGTPEVDDANEVLAVAGKGKTKKAQKPLKGKTTTYNAGSVTGPIKIPISHSIDPIEVKPMGITRCALTNFDDTNLGKDQVAKKKAAAAGSQDSEIDLSVATSGQMGSKWVVPYALYRLDGSINPQLGLKCGLSQADIDLFFLGLEHCLEEDISSARNLRARDLIIWQHEDRFGNAPSFALEERTVVVRISEGPARKFQDYRVTVAAPPQGVTLERRISTFNDGLLSIVG